jgi:hypothetical protein
MLRKVVVNRFLDGFLFLHILLFYQSYLFHLFFLCFKNNRC